MREDASGYMAEYRSRSPRYVDRQRVLNRIRSRALTELAKQHHIQLRQIIIRMCREEGITPPDER
jgi:hypothetical protein